MRKGQKKGKKPIFLDKRLVEGIDEVLKVRGSSVEQFLELQLVRFVRQTAVHGLEDKLTFGQYEGAIVKDVCSADMAYMYWLVVEQKSKKFKREVFNYIATMAHDEGKAHLPDLIQVR